MEYYVLPEFQSHISKLLQEGKVDSAINEITRAIQDAEKLKDEEEVCCLYSNLAGIYFVQDKLQDALAVLKECEAKYPNSVFAKFIYLEKLFWYFRNYEETIQKAEAIIELVEMNLNYYHKSLYLKGLAHAELGQFQQAIEMLRRTDYADLALVEKLMAHRVGLADCREFLLRALNKHKAFQVRGKDVADKINRIEALISQLDIV